jgi:hypothetical protein
MIKGGTLQPLQDHVRKLVAARRLEGADVARLHNRRRSLGQLGEQRPFTNELVQELRPPGRWHVAERGKDLHRHRTFPELVLGLVDDGKTPLADHRLERVLVRDRRSDQIERILRGHGRLDHAMPAPIHGAKERVSRSASAPVAARFERSANGEASRHGRNGLHRRERLLDFFGLERSSRGLAPGRWQLVPRLFVFARRRWRRRRDPGRRRGDRPVCSRLARQSELALDVHRAKLSTASVLRGARGPDCLLPSPVRGGDVRCRILHGRARLRLLAPRQNVLLHPRRHELEPHPVRGDLSNESDRL